jgi:hypothetical protein
MNNIYLFLIQHTLSKGFVNEIFKQKYYDMKKKTQTLLKQ